MGVVESIDYSDYWKVTEIKYLGLNVPNLKDYKWFYLKSNAEKYIEENKPQFSKKDVLSYGKFFFTKGAFRTTILTVEELFNEYAEYKKLNK